MLGMIHELEKTGKCDHNFINKYTSGWKEFNEIGRAHVCGENHMNGLAERHLQRVKAALRDFSRESNLSVITEDGAYYSFNVKYADEPVKLSVEMADFLHDGEAVNRPNNALDIYLQEFFSWRWK